MDNYDFPAMVAQVLRMIYPNLSPIENEDNNADPNASSSVSVTEKSNDEFGNRLFATLTRLIRFVQQFNKVRAKGNKGFVNQVKRTELIPMSIYLLESCAEATVATALDFLFAFIDATEKSKEKRILNCDEMISVLEAYDFMFTQHSAKRNEVKFMESITRLVYQAATHDVVISALLEIDSDVAVHFLLDAPGSRLFPRIFLTLVEEFLRDCPCEVAESFFEQGVQQN
jgi:hypothetical protein